ELVYYLAKARSAEYNLAAGQPLRLRLEREQSLDGFKLEPPSGGERPLAAPPTDSSKYPAQIVPQPRGALLVYDRTRETGVYRLTTPEGKVVPYVVQPDEQEANLTPCTEAERQRVADLIGVKYENDRVRMVAALLPTNQRLEVWWWFLLGLIALLCG